MKTKKMRFISTIMATVLAIGALSGCGGKESNISKVRVWTTEGATKVFMEEAVNDFNKTIGAEKNIQIEYKVISSGIDDMAKSAFENGDGPEIIGASLNTLKQFRKLGFNIPITDLAGGQEYIDSLGIEIPDSQTNRYEGKIYSFPVSSITGGLVYNKDLFKAVGFVDENGEAKAPETWDEVIEVGKKIRAYDNTKYGIAFPFKDGFVWGYAMGWAMSASSNGTKYDWENKTVEYSDITISTMLKAKNADICFPGSESLDNDTLRLQFAEGNIGMFLGCTWDVGVLTEQFPARCDWDVAPYPVINKNDKYLQNGQVSSSVGIGNSAKKTPEMENAVLEVYKWLYSDDIILEKYKMGQSVPYSSRLLEKAQNIEVAPQLKKFCELQKITRVPVDYPSLKLEGDSLGVLYERVWMGEISAEDAIKDINARASKAFKSGIEDGTLKKEDYSTDKDFSRK